MSPSHRSSTLPTDERGAVLVMAVFMSVLLVAMLYFVVGIGEAVFRREGLGDAADAAAFAAAILHARGMNLIAFINLVMAALLAVLVALRVVQAVFVIGIAVCVASAYPSYGASLAYVPTFAQQAKNFGDYFEKAKDVIFPALEALHQAERVTSYVVPAIAVLDSAREASQSHPPAVAGVALPGAVRLPVEPDTFEELCARAGANVAEIVTWPLADIGMGPAAGMIEEAGYSLAKSAPSFFCGEGNGEPPTYTSSRNVTYPESPDAAKCDGSAASSSACERAKYELEEAMPHETTGNCQGEDCSLKGSYERYAREARSACRPRDGFYPYEYTWQEVDVDVEYTFHAETGWVAGKRYRSSGQLKSKRPVSPCGPHGEVAKDWKLEPHPEGQLTPLCAEASEPPSTKGYPGEVRSVRHKEVPHLFSCTVKEAKTEEPMKGEKALGKDGGGKEPHRVLKDAALGENLFQLRSLVWGDDSDAVAENVVKLATWGKPTNDTWGSLGFDALGDIAIAQAEYYYDHDGSEARSEWLWNMKWTARLVRFRMAGNDSNEGKSQSQEKWENDSAANAGAFDGLADVSSFGALCKTAGFEQERCGALDASAGMLDGLILH
jgi:hypothetical protein